MLFGGSLLLCLLVWGYQMGSGATLLTWSFGNEMDPADVCYERNHPKQYKIRAAGDFVPCWSLRLWAATSRTCSRHSRNGRPPVPFRGEAWIMGNLCFQVIPRATLVTQNQSVFNPEAEAAYCPAVVLWWESLMELRLEPHSLEQAQAAEQVGFINQKPPVSTDGVWPCQHLLIYWSAHLLNVTVLLKR